MKNYLDVLTHLLTHGEPRETRNGKTWSAFGISLSFDLQQGFPVMTTKEVDFNYITAELLWFLRGSRDLNLLNVLCGKEPGAKNIWTGDANNFALKDRHQFPGDVGRIYGVQWTDWTSVNAQGQVVKTNQLVRLVKQLKEDPMSRYHLLQAWNPGELDQMSLPACHMMAQFYVTNSGHLLCHMVQRSADFFLGVPWNISSYALLTHILALYCGLRPGSLDITFMDAHIYDAHKDQVMEQIRRTPDVLPKLLIAPTKDFNLGLDFPEFVETLKTSDFQLSGYRPQGKIKAPLLTAVTKAGATTF